MTPGNEPDPTRRVYLVDNGSLREDAWRMLAGHASRLRQLTGLDVEPASLLHSDRLPPEMVDGFPPRTLEPTIRAAWLGCVRRFHVQPFFLAPSAAWTEYWPARLAVLRREWGDFECRTGPVLGPTLERDDGMLTALLAVAVRERIGQAGLVRPAVVLVDHGSPQPTVTAVRDFIAQRLAQTLAGEVAWVQAASMERRPGASYAFNEPLLAELLRRPECTGQPVVVALFFLSPGRHAGPDGDIASICREAELVSPGLSTWRTEPLGLRPGFGELLLRRLREGLGGAESYRDELGGSMNVR